MTNNIHDFEQCAMICLLALKMLVTMTSFQYLVNYVFHKYLDDFVICLINDVGTKLGGNYQFCNSDSLSHIILGNIKKN